MTSTELWIDGTLATLLFASFAYTWNCYRAVANAERELSDYKVEVATRYTMVGYTRDVETRAVNALQEIRQQLRDQGEKIDRLIERGVK